MEFHAFDVPPSPFMHPSFRSSQGMGSFSCFHGGKEGRPTLEEGDLTDWFQTSTTRIVEFYEEAARRLPLKEMPELDGCICAGGLCLGLADPVSNIILNAVALLLHDEQGDGEHHPPAHRRRVRVRTKGWWDIASRSVNGAGAFMNAYFRYLSTTHARRYLHLASQDLPLAIKLVHHDRYGPRSPQQRRPLLPDGGKLKAALRFAALQAEHPAPDLLARLMTAQYPCDTLAPVLSKLRSSGKEQLTINDVLEIKDLLARQWPPTPPPANIDFWCRPNGRTCTRGDNGVLVISTCIGEGLVAQTSILNAGDYFFQTQQQEYISDLVFHSDVMDTQLSKCLQVSALKASAVATEVNYDVPPCEHIISMKMCLLDTIHAFYIKALATLPSKPSLLRALLVAGHCYGRMDPVSNIILNSFWYDVAFPLAHGVEVDLPQGILDTRPMARLESRSLDGLVAILQGTCGSKHHALEYLSSFNCDLSGSYHVHLIIRREGYIAFADAAEIAKHPQHTVFGSFLMSLTPEKITRLCSLISDARWDQLITILRNEVCSVGPMSVLKEEDSSPVSPFLSLKISEKKLAFNKKLDFVRTELNKVLHKYCNQHPWEPSYQLDIICGVTASSSLRHPNFYHANFLATIDDATASPRERTLFFAEFWVPPLSEDVQSKPSSCCPIYDYRSCIGRCSFCENEGNKILHPPSGGHSNDFDGSINLYRSAVMAQKDGFKGLLESDIIYFDPGRDVELAKVISEHRDHEIFGLPECPPPRMPGTKPSLVWEWM